MYIVSSKELPAPKFIPNPEVRNGHFLGMQTSMTIRAFYPPSRWMILQKWTFFEVDPWWSPKSFLSDNKKRPQPQLRSLPTWLRSQTRRQTSATTLGVKLAKLHCMPEGKQCSLPILHLWAKDPKFRKGWVAGVGVWPLANGDHNYHVSNTSTWIHAMYIYLH